MAEEYKSTGVGVFLLNPGLVETDMLQDLHFIQGYEHNLKVLRVVKRLLANPPEEPAKKALWLASSATDGRTGLHASSIGPGRMVKGITQELSRVIRRLDPPPYNPHVTLVKPLLETKIPNKPSRINKRDPQSDYIYHLQDKRLPHSVGNKAMNIWHLSEKGFLVPDTYILTWDAFLAYQRKGAAIMEEIKSRLEQVLDPEQRYAVRSSADVEDSLDYSFAGQFTTVLDVKGIDQVLNAILKVWDSTKLEKLETYAERSHKDHNNLRMAVIIQKMVDPSLSGVSFSVNPITSLDDITVEAVEGRGDQLVQEGITPLRWVMKWGKWIEQPESSEVAPELIHKVVDQTKKISKTFKREVDLEWVYDGEKIYWVQMRDITAVVKADIYSNRIAKEMTPGMVKPLDWSVVVAIKSAVVLDIITKVIGKNDITATSLVKAFHYRTYHNLGVFGQIFDILGMPRESLEIMMGVAPHGAGKPAFKPGPKFIRLLPRVVRFIWEMWAYSKTAREELPKLESEAKKYTLQPGKEFDDQLIVNTIDELSELNTKLSYSTMITMLLMQIYNGVFSSQLKKMDIDPADFNLTEGMNELRQYDPNHRLEALHREYLELEEHLQEEIKHSKYQGLKTIPGITDFSNEVNDFLEQFGHMSDRTGVFDTIPWRETPDLILELIINFEKPDEREPEKILYEDLELKGMRGMMLKTFYHRARQFRLFREKYSSLYTYSLMLFRVYYIALGDRLVDRRLLDSREDIYYLYDQEIRAYVAEENSGKYFKDLVAKRKQEMERCEPAILPEIIYGNTPPPVVVHSDKKLTGTPTSRGYFTGKTKVVRGIGDFNKLAHGDVLVIPYSDVGWIPLFAKAGAVIAESGGMLSHSSIIAREYGIPAVVSVSGALQLADDLLVSIDGYKGEVHVHG
jgi:pyruvate,water dikinase